MAPSPVPPRPSDAWPPRPVPTSRSIDRLLSWLGGGSRGWSRRRARRAYVYDELLFAHHHHHHDHDTGDDHDSGDAPDSVGAYESGDEYDSGNEYESGGEYDNELGRTSAGLSSVWRRGPAPGRRHLPVIAGLTLSLAVAWWLVRPAPPPLESVIPAAGESLPAASAEVGGGGASSVASPVATAVDGTAVTGDSSVRAPSVPELVVQAAGAVVRPGVYRLATGSRVDDLVRRAGGTAPDADLDRVNLAAALNDGERVWIPRRGEVEAPAVVAGSGGSASGGGGAPGAGSGTVPAGPVDINTATAEDLDALPGIGPATAAAILAHRESQGRFTSVEDLLDVRGIGDAKLEQLRPLVTV